jgi:hypothetical protein
MTEPRRFILPHVPTIRPLPVGTSARSPSTSVPAGEAGGHRNPPRAFVASPWFTATLG